MFVGSVLMLILSFVVTEIISVRRSTRDLERRIRHWRGNSGQEKREAARMVYQRAAQRTAAQNHTSKKMD